VIERIDVLLVVLVLAAILGYRYAADRRRSHADRAQLFVDCLTMFDTVHVTCRRTGYPVLAGQHRGLAVTIEPLIDHLSVRKLPQLWAVVTLRAALPWTAVVSVVARPQNTEFYSPWGSLPHTLPQCFGWPSGVHARTNDPDGTPPRDVLDRGMALFDDQRLKELLITPRGLRLVYQIAQADRGRYVLLRQAAFPGARLPASTAQWLLDAIEALYHELREPSSTPAAVMPNIADRSPRPAERINVVACGLTV
jgi:hypothetical protein